MADDASAFLAAYSNQKKAPKPAPNVIQMWEDAEKPDADPTQAAEALARLVHGITLVVDYRLDGPMTGLLESDLADMPPALQRSLLDYLLPVLRRARLDAAVKAGSEHLPGG